MEKNTTDVVISEEILELTKNKKITKSTVIRHIKFFLIPGWRDPEFGSREYEIEKIKSKRRFFRRLLTPLTIMGISFILFIVFLAIYAPWLTIFTQKMITDGGISGETPFAPPSTLHPLGNTQFGYDILARLIWGARTAIQFGFISISISVAGGVVLGTITGFLGGRVDAIIMRIIDFLMIFPTTIIIILITQISEDQSLFNMLIIFGLFGITGFTRLMRASVLQVKQELYIEAAVTGGARRLKIMLKHIMPNAISPIVIRFFGGVGFAVLAFAGIAFLGFGDSTLADWGTDINYARSRLSAIHASFWPGVLIIITILGFMLLGDGLRDALDPRLQQSSG